MSDNRGTNRSAAAYVVSLAPDVCLTPLGSGMVPVPYTITCKFDVAQGTATRTRFGGQPVFTMGSYLPTVQGDEPGTGGGLISGVNLGACRPMEHSTSVRVEGHWLVRHSDLMAMNCAGPKGAANTYGKIVYIGVKTSARIGPEGEIIRQPPENDTQAQPGETAANREEPAATEISYDPTTDPEYQETLEQHRQAEAEIAAAKREIAWEATKAGVDAAGLIDPTPISDLTSAGMSIADGDYWGAGLSIVSVVPYLGDAIAKPIKATRMARKATKLAEKLRGLRKGKKPKPPGGGAGSKKPDGGHVPGRETRQGPDVPKKPYVPNRQLPKDEHGHKLPESDYSHTQLGTKTSKRTGEIYPQTREWGAKGDRGYDGRTPKRDTDWTNHDRPRNHSNPHDHPYNPDTGKRL